MRCYNCQTAGLEIGPELGNLESKLAGYRRVLDSD